MKNKAREIEDGGGSGEAKTLGWTSPPAAKKKKKTTHRMRRGAEEET